MTIPKIPRVALLLVCFMPLALALVASRSVTAAKAEAAVARKAEQAAVLSAGHALAHADSVQRAAEALRVERDSATARAARFEHSATRLTGKLSALEAAAPDTCRPIIVTADSALAAKDGTIHELHTALDRSVASEASLQSAVDTLRPALIHLRSTSTALVKADAKLASRSWLSKILPHPAIGEAFGVDAQGQPHLTTAIMLGWSF